MSWVREDDAEEAVDRILDAAGATFLAKGIGRTQMADVARAAGCSRATLYRYFATREALRLAYVEREARTVAAGVAAFRSRRRDPAARLADEVLAAIGLVRANPALAAWFTTADLGLASAVAGSSTVVEALTGDLLRGANGELAARWVVRVIVSLLAMPGRDAAEEREMVERFVAPGLLPGRDRRSDGRLHVEAGAVGRRP